MPLCSSTPVRRRPEGAEENSIPNIASTGHTTVSTGPEADTGRQLKPFNSFIHSLFLYSITLNDPLFRIALTDCLKRIT